MAGELGSINAFELQEQLEALEREVGMSPEKFYVRFRRGQLDNSPENVQWAGICFLAVRAGLLAPRASN
jgi:hypothetical protein